MDEDRRIVRLEKQILEAENTIKQMKSLNEILQLRAGKCHISILDEESVHNLLTKRT